MPRDEQIPTSFDYGSARIRLGVLMSKYSNNKEMAQEKDKLRNDLDKLERYKADILNTFNRCTDIYKDVLENLKTKKQVALNEFNETIRAVAEVVADSEMRAMKLVVEDKRAVIVNGDGWCVNDLEGSACRSCTHMSMRHAIFTSLPNVFPIMIMDESFFTLSENTSIEMSERIKLYSQYYVIIGVEQKETLFSTINNKRVFEFNKIDGLSRIREVDSKWQE